MRKLPLKLTNKAGVSYSCSGFLLRVVGEAATRRAVVAMHAEYYYTPAGLFETAARWETSPMTLVTVFREFGLPRKPKGPHKKVPPALREARQRREVRALFHAGATVARIAKLYGISRQAVYNQSGGRRGGGIT